MIAERQAVKAVSRITEPEVCGSAGCLSIRECSWPFLATNHSSLATPFFPNAFIALLRDAALAPLCILEGVFFAGAA
jgi:hypothetical protein